MNLNSIRTRLSLLLAAFAFLIVVSFGATIWSLESQSQDALVINLAGRQRMLIQQMQRDASQISHPEHALFASSLKEAAATFEQTLNALQHGGAAPYKPGQSIQVRAASNPQIRANLEQLGASWAGFSNAIDALLNASPETDQFAQSSQTIHDLSPGLLEQADQVVRLYEAETEAKISRLRLIQASFLIAAILLLGVGGLVTTRSVTEPLRNLEKSASRIGAGDLSVPVSVSGLREVTLLSSTMDRMRQELKNSRDELVEWTGNLEQRVAQRTNELEALNQVSNEIASRLELPQVLNSVVNKTCQLLEAEAVYLCLLDESGAQMRLQAILGPEGTFQATSTSSRLPPVSEVLDADTALSCGVANCRSFCQIIHPRYRASQLVAPLRTGDNIIGALCVGSRKAGAFSAESETLLTRLAVIAAIAIENARLYAQAERAASLEERQCIAAEIHDGLAQTLSYLQLLTGQITQEVQTGQNIEALCKLESIQDALDRAMADTRRALGSLQEQRAPREVLQDQISLLVERAAPLCPAAIEWSSTQTAPVVLSHQDSEQILRIVQEALNNACQHSQATHIAVCLETRDQEYALIIRDNGVGFDPQRRAQTDGHNHFGLKIMQARAARAGGKLILESRQGSGTHVILTWPKIK